MMNKVKTALAAATIFAAVGMAGAASAQVSSNFTPNPSGNPGPNAPGVVVVQNFNTNTTGMSGAFQVFNSNVPNQGTQPNNSGSRYIGVLGGNTATYTFASPTTTAQFDWGTVSADNTLTVLYTQGGTAMSTNFTVQGSAPNGPVFDQNGIFTATAAAGSFITGLQFTAATNSFEVDNISAAVPEPATWGMMMLGFGMIGAAARRRRQPTLSFA